MQAVHLVAAVNSLKKLMKFWKTNEVLLCPELSLTRSTTYGEGNLSLLIYPTANELKCNFT